MPDTVLPTKFKAQALIKGERYQDLDRRQTYFDCTQHDWKRYDFDGRFCRPGPVTQQPLLTSEVAPFFVPLRQRRPASPVRMGKIVVDAFTNILFGEERWPRFLCQGDDDTQDYAGALEKAAGLLLKMIEARNLGGAVGTVGLSWCFRDGKPRVEVHNAKNLYVHSWVDRDDLIPETVSEVYLYPVDEYDAEKGKMVRNQYWYRHDWTPEREIAYLPVKLKGNEEPIFVEDLENSTDHGFGECPFVWVQNVPANAIDGRPDYDGQYEAMDTLDVIASVLARGTALNLDPTLVLKMNPEILKRTGVKKGSDQAIAVGESGDAKYLELAGTGVEAGIKVFQLKRMSILEASQCVVPDPNEVAASGTSSVAIKAIYQPMLGRGAVLREQYGKAMKRILEGMLRVARKTAGTTIPVTSVDPETGEETVEEAVQVIDLPPRVREIPKKKPKPPSPFGGPPEPPAPEDEEDEDQDPDADKPDVETTERVPGEGEYVDLSWGEWFPLTPQDRNQAVQALQLASGGKAVLSQQTSVEEAAVIFNRNPAEEWSRLQAAQQDDQAREALMFPPAGGGVALDPKTGEMKPAGSPNPQPPGVSPTPKPGFGNPFAKPKGFGGPKKPKPFG